MSAPVYLPDRTYLVDALATNYLVRGNQPLQSDETTFAYDAMNTKLKSLIGGDFDLTNYKLLDVSIIDNNPAGERPLLEAEFVAYGVSKTEFDKYFPWPGSWPPVAKSIDVKKQYGAAVAGHAGSVIWYPVQGCVSMDNCSAIEPPQFDFIGLIAFLRSLMETEKNTVIYFHCEHGHDRTSAVTGGYMIKYLEISLNDVLTEGPPGGAKAFSHAWESNYEMLVKYYNANYDT